MGFDEDPTDVENYPCPECGKPAYKSEFLNFSWACSGCSWVASSAATGAAGNTDLIKEQKYD